MPCVKERYRTTAETAIAGESLAGLFVMECFLVEPELFHTYIAIDPSLWWNDQKLLASASDRIRARPNLRKSLWFASSDEKGIVTGTQRLAEILRKDSPRGSTGTEPMPEEHHGTIYHPAALKAFRGVFKPAAGK